ncbi:MAG: replicative DNA helicase [Mariprofundaceae bacterium]|nr:replicative DNA helicase [Mariprofundaceae bacterium]
MSQAASQSLRSRTPPHAYDAERAVLGCLMLDPESLELLEGDLHPEHFYVEANRLVFQAIQELSHQGQPADAITIKDYLEQRAQLSNCGGEPYLADLLSVVGSVSNIKKYAQLVRDRSTMRQLLSACGEIVQDVYDESERQVAAHLDEAEKRIMSIAEHFSRDKPAFSSMNELMVESYRELEARYAEQKEIVGLTSGFKDLDEKTSGLQRGDLIIVAGRPSMGKTAFAMNLARHAAFDVDGKEAVAVFSLEMSSQQIAMRMLASEARINMQSLRTGKFSAEDWRKIATATGSLSESSLYIDDTAAISVLELRSKCRRLKRERGLALVVVDYLQLMSGRSNVERRDQEISEMTRALKGLAKELSVPVVVLSQLNRSLESRADKRPMMSDLRESGAIEQDADIIMFVYRDEVYNKKPENEGLAEIIIGKQRNGPTGTVKLTFIGQYTRFENNTSMMERD